MVGLYLYKKTMGRLDKLKRQVIAEANKRILNEGNNPSGNTLNNLYLDLTDEHLEEMLEKVSHDDAHLSHLHNELSMGGHNNHNSNFMDTLNHSVHAHYDINSNHVSLQFPHLGKHHDIEIDVEGSFGHHDSHGNEPISLELSPTVGGTIKLPLHFKSKH